MYIVGESALLPQLVWDGGRHEGSCRSRGTIVVGAATAPAFSAAASELGARLAPIIIPTASAALSGGRQPLLIPSATMVRGGGAKKGGKRRIIGVAGPIAVLVSAAAIIIKTVRRRRSQSSASAATATHLMSSGSSRGFVDAARSSPSIWPWKEQMPSA